MEEKKEKDEKRKKKNEKKQGKVFREKARESVQRKYSWRVC